LTGYLTDYSGQIWQLPVLLSWEMKHGLGTPCDAFEISFLYERGMLEILSGAVRFRGVWQNETVFLGVVDEFEVTADEAGCVAVVRGRGMAALLLDNEAEAAQYYNASLAMILERHVYPWGVTQVRTAEMPKAPSFSVTSGASQWSVLENFAWFCGGVRPRVSKDGVLLLNGERGAARMLDGGTAMTAQLYRVSRYGVISQVLVKNKVRGITSVVDNEAFLARGGSARRVVNVPRNTYYDAMRRTGNYQIQRSKLGSVQYELTLAEQFAAFAGDVVTLSGSALGADGIYQVTESRCWADGSGAGTVLMLEPEEKGA
jgi:hypothetical protein